MEQKARYVAFSAVFCLSLCCATAHAQLRVVTWNTAGGPRTGLGDVLEAIGNESVNGIAKPIDVLSLQEQSSSATTTQLIVDLLNVIYGAGTYDRATIDGDTAGAGRPGLIYNTTTVSLESQIAFGEVNTSAQARQTLRYQLRPVGYDADFYVYSNHYKASTGSTNEGRRLIEATAVRADADALGQGANIIYTGDFNIRSSNENMYDVALLGPGNGQAFDPINAPGSWHDSSAFKSVHTQAPSSSPPVGLVGGGVDDRFDFQLVTDELLDDEGLSYIPGSYHAFGNNGTHNLNGSISTGTGATPSILSTLEMASDHLPVVADYQVPALMGIAVSPDIVPAKIPQSSLVEFVITIENIADVVASLGADELDYQAIGSDGVLGSYVDSDFALGGGNAHTFTLDTSVLGMMNGLVTVDNLSPESLGGFVVPFDFEVVPAFDSADFDQDGVIDGADFLAWQRGFGVGSLFSEGDANGSGTVDAADLTIWESQYATSGGAIATVPEPSTVALLLLGFAIACKSPRRWEAVGFVGRVELDSSTHQ